MPQTQEEITNLYNGAVTLGFNAATHRYRITDGDKVVRCPSVTTVVSVIDKPALVQWAANKANEVWLANIKPGESYGEILLGVIAQAAARAHREIKEEAAAIGTQVHQALEAILKGAEEVNQGGLQAEQVRSRVSSASQWLTEHRVEPIHIERRVYSRRLRVSGTLDLIALVDGIPSLLDYKTSKGIWSTMWLQTAAYCKMYEEETGERITRRYLLHINKEDGVVTPHLQWSRASLEKDFRAFRAALVIYNRLKELRRVS